MNLLRRSARRTGVGSQFALGWPERGQRRDAVPMRPCCFKPGVMDPVGAERPRRGPRPGHCARIGAHLPPLPVCRGPGDGRPGRDLVFARCWPTTPSSRSSRAAARWSIWRSAPPYTSGPITVPLRDSTTPALTKLSRDGQLSLNLAEMQTIQAHFRARAAIRPTSSWKRWPRPGRSTARTRRSRGTSTSTAGASTTAQGDDLRRHAGDPPAARRRRLVRQRLRGQRRRRALRRALPRLLQGRDAQPSVGDRALRRRQHRPGRRHPRSARHRPRRQADLQHRRLLLRPARHAAGSAAARRAASAAR